MKESFLRSGQIKERLFSALINASASELLADLQGVDMSLTISFNVKGQKKVRRSDEAVSNELHWLEIQKHTGHVGWVFKGSDFIAFELEHTWLVVARERLEDLVRIKVSKEVSKEPEPFKLYHRKNFKSKQGKVDILTLIPVKDLRTISTLEIAKA